MLDESTFHQNYLMHPRQFGTITMEQFAEKKHSNIKNPPSLFFCLQLYMYLYTLFKNKRFMLDEMT